MVRPQRIAIVGGGPAGLFLARMTALTQPHALVEVFERNGPDNVSGFGVALSDRTMRTLSRHDPDTHVRIERASAALSGIELRLPDATMRYDGFGTRAVSRHALLTILREQAQELGVRVHTGRGVGADELDADVIALADGVSAAHQPARREAFDTSIRTGTARYVWLGTGADLDDVATLTFVRTPYGPMAAHSYPYGADLSTVVVELDDATWRRAGFAGASGHTRPSDEIDQPALDLLGAIFADLLGGQPLVSNASRWSRFAVVSHRRWSRDNVVLLGDAAHTAHFTVSSGTKMALEDAIALAAALREHPDPPSAFAAYERRRRAPVSRTQRWAEPSMSWWETYGRRMQLPPAQFGMHFLTRTVAISYLGLRRRCGERIDEAEAEFARHAGLDAHQPGRNAVATPLRLTDGWLPSRVVTWQSPVAGSVGGLVPAGWRPYRDAALPSTEDARPSAPADVRRGVRPAAPVFAELACPDEPEWTRAADDLVVRARSLRGQGMAGVFLRPGGFRPGWWYETLRHASRIRTEAGLVVAVCVPQDWTLDLARTADTDPWPVRIHLALISGRVDLVVACPLSPVECARAAEPATER